MPAAAELRRHPRDVELALGAERDLDLAARQLAEEDRDAHAVHGEKRRRELRRVDARRPPQASIIASVMPTCGDRSAGGQGEPGERVAEQAGVRGRVALVDLAVAAGRIRAGLQQLRGDAEALAGDVELNRKNPVSVASPA